MLCHQHPMTETLFSNGHHWFKTVQNVNFTSKLVQIFLNYYGFFEHPFNNFLRKTCIIREYNGIDYFVATRRIVNIDRKILCHDMSLLFGKSISQRRLKASLPYFVKLGSTTSWVNQALCAKCFNMRYTVNFLKKLGNTARDSLLKIMTIEGLESILFCGNEIDPRICLLALTKTKCFLHSNSKSAVCQGL